jgi:hypothetical protein
VTLIHILLLQLVDPSPLDSHKPSYVVWVVALLQPMGDPLDFFILISPHELLKVL